LETFFFDNLTYEQLEDLREKEPNVETYSELFKKIFAKKFNSDLENYKDRNTPANVKRKINERMY
jgi:cation transport regulator ChaB